MKTVNWNSHIISKLCLGTVQFGLDYGISNQDGEVSQQDVNSILEYVSSKDINCFDTGSMYGNSEEKIGNYLKNRDLNTMIVSKIKSDFFQVEHEISIQRIENSLTYLSSSTLFALLLHNIEAIENWSSKDDELISKLKKQNKIKYFGMSIYNNNELNLALNNKNVDIIQIPFNLLDQRAITNHWLTKAKETNKLLFIRSVYLQGLILMEDSSIPNHLNIAKPYLNIIDKLANSLNITKNKLALSFVNQTAQNAILLFGCDSLAQAIENIDNYNHLPKLDHQTIKYLTKHLSNIDEHIYNPSKWGK